MSLLRYIRDNQQIDADRFFITRDQLYRLGWFVLLSWHLMREFKRKADVYHIKTRWNKPYRAMKAYFTERGK